MKKCIAIILIFTTLLLTACNNNIEDTSISTSRTNPVESTSVLQTTENKPQETTTETLQTFETTTKNKTDEEQINILKDQIISQKNKSAFIELPSRILFTQPKSKDILMGNTYTSVLGSYVSYYSKADGENYIYCFDPLCDHQDCGAFGLPISSAVLCNERFYTAMMKSFSSFAFDGTDKRNISLTEEFDGCTFWNLHTYAEYLYIEALMPTGEQHILQYNTKNENCIDLTEKTGNFINIDFFYNDIIYGYNNGLPIQCDLHFENIQEIEDFRFQYDLIEGSRFIWKCMEEKIIMAKSPLNVLVFSYMI
ncbi:MAG: hypothetical protein IJ489_05170 [Clostridia bacterium]|nr:hypothetical protein [Clostridia bacterium]